MNLATQNPFGLIRGLQNLQEIRLGRAPGIEPPINLAAPRVYRGFDTFLLTVGMRNRQRRGALLRGNQK